MSKIQKIHIRNFKAIDDASYLDKKNLEAIHEWAVKNDLQLLIERPAYDGGGITYELIEG